MDFDSEETRAWMSFRDMLADFRVEIPTRKIRSATTSGRLEDPEILDALCRYREILRRETDFLRGEVTSRGFGTFAGKQNYIESQSDRIYPHPPERPSPARCFSVGVRLPHLVTDPQESLEFLLHESHHLRYRIQSLASILRKFSIPFSSEKDKLMLIRMSLVAVMICRAMKHYSKQDATSSQLLHRDHWESIWGSKRTRHGVFDDMTTLSPMQFTPSTPGIPTHSGAICSALQIYSLKIVELNKNLNWPLHVYGVVAARDTVDHNRNLLFYRSRAKYQLVTQNDPFLRLTGPSRAIVSRQPVTFEVELKLKYPGAEHQDRALFFCTYTWRAMQDTTPLFQGYSCAAELSLEQLPRAIQATILGVHIIKGSWPSGFGCRVSCSLSSGVCPTPREVELLNYSSSDYGKKSPVGLDDYIGLERNVVSAQLESKLKVVIQAKSRTRRVLCSYVEFPVLQHCQTSKASCFLCDCEIEVVVAWSLLVQDKRDLMCTNYYELDL